MATLQDFRNERLRKLDELKALGVNPYPAKATRTHDIATIHAQFAELENQAVSVVGRVVSIRKFGKLAFVVVTDQTDETLQLIWRRGDAEVDYANSELSQRDITLLDTGDFVEATGAVVKSQTGEESVELTKLRLLTKSLRPMPSKIDGFTNKEERFRRRYVDMNVNPDVRARFVRRSNFWRATREFLQTEGFVEVNNTVLENTAGGADANPFVTHMDAPRPGVLLAYFPRATTEALAGSQLRESV